MAYTRLDLSNDVAKIFRGIEWFLRVFVSTQAPLLFVIYECSLPSSNSFRHFMSDV